MTEAPAAAEATAGERAATPMPGGAKGQSAELALSNPPPGA